MNSRHVNSNTWQPGFDQTTSHVDQATQNFNRKVWMNNLDSAHKNLKNANWHIPSRNIIDNHMSYPMSHPVVNEPILGNNGKGHRSHTRWSPIEGCPTYNRPEGKLENQMWSRNDAVEQIRSNVPQMRPYYVPRPFHQDESGSLHTIPYHNQFEAPRTFNTSRPFKRSFPSAVDEHDAFIRNDAFSNDSRLNHDERNKAGWFAPGHRRGDFSGPQYKCEQPSRMSSQLPVCWSNKCLDYSSTESTAYDYNFREERPRKFSRSCDRPHPLHREGDDSPNIWQNRGDVNVCIEDSLKTTNMYLIQKIEEVLENPGRKTRSKRIIIVLRGLPGSGKSFTANKIVQLEVAHGGQKPKILSIDPYFMVDKDASDTTNGSKPDGVRDADQMVYQFDRNHESSYERQLQKAALKEMRSGLYEFLIIDNVNYLLSQFDGIFQNAGTFGYKISRKWEPLHRGCNVLDATNIQNEDEIDYIEMEDATPQDDNTLPTSQAIVDGDESTLVDMFPSNPCRLSKWELADSDLDRLDGVKMISFNKQIQKVDGLLDTSEISESFLNKSSKSKRVRWADIEERKSHEHRKELGFVVGQTEHDWDRMSNTYDPDKALAAYKYI